MTMMQKGIDYAWGRPGGKTIKNAGFNFACRYLSHNSRKNINHAEVLDLHAAGVKVVLVWETTEQRPLEGQEAGIADANAALDLARVLGLPDDKPIYFAADYDFTPQQQSAINFYFKGIASVMPLHRIGVYGGYYVVQRCFDAKLVTFGWQTRAWSGGKWEPRAGIKQVQFNYMLNNVNCDINEAVLDNFGQW